MSDLNPVVVDMTPAEARWVAGLLRDVAADYAPYAERAFLRFAAVLDSAREVEFRIIDGKSFAIEDDDVECFVEVQP